MATLICEKCGTRNADTMLTCRRCTAPLGKREASINMLGGRWSVGPGLESNPQLFSGRNIETGEEVLIKRLSRTAALDRSVRSSFIKEASILRDLEHPHLIRVIDVIEDPASGAIVLARPEGQSLESYLERREFLPIPVAIAFGLQLLGTLDYLHERGVVHRNLTSKGIFITRNEDTGLPHLMITDFGLARNIHLAAGQDSSETGTLLGMKVAPPEQTNPTPYMAPELLQDEADSRSDIYSLGVLLFEMITGRLPVGHGVRDPAQLISAIENEAPTILRLLKPEVSSALEDTLLRMMSKRPDQRYLDISETRAALLACTDATMVRVPEGPFLRGSAPSDDAARGEEFPQKPIWVSAFYMDRLPVTVAQFHSYLKASGLEMPEAWHKHNPSEFGDLPVVHVTWHEAKAYAEWRGCRLATEAEWEKAARGEDGRIYPWGHEAPRPEHAQFASDVRAAVASHPAGASPYGCLDMAGNCFEWVEDWYSSNYYPLSPEADPKGPNAGEKKVLRGGSFVHDAAALRCASRGRYVPDERRANHGFRCAWSFD